MSYFVSRQCYWGVEPEEQNTVEIAHGGLDYANPDMLVSKYQGEGEDYYDPRRALEAAISVADSWKKDSPSLTINIAHGFTGGNTLPFEPDTLEDLKKWAEEAYEKLPKCAQCGEILGKEKWHTEQFPDEMCCSQYCAEKYESDNTITDEE